MQTLKCGRCTNTREVPESIITDHKNPWNIKYMQRALWVYLRWKQNPTGGWVCGDCAAHMYANATLILDLEVDPVWLADFEDDQEIAFLDSEIDRKRGE